MFSPSAFDLAVRAGCRCLEHAKLAAARGEFDEACEELKKIGLTVDTVPLDGNALARKIRAEVSGRTQALKVLVAQITDVHLGFDPGNPDEFNRQRLEGVGDRRPGDPAVGDRALDDSKQHAGE